MKAIVLLNSTVFSLIIRRMGNENQKVVKDLLELCLDLFHLLGHQWNDPGRNVREIIGDQNVQWSLSIPLGPVKAESVSPLGVWICSSVHNTIIEPVNMVVDSVECKALGNCGVVIVEEFNESVDLLGCHISSLEKDLLISIEEKAVCPFWVLALELGEVDGHLG